MKLSGLKICYISRGLIRVDYNGVTVHVYICYTVKYNEVAV